MKRAFLLLIAALCLHTIHGQDSLNMTKLANLSGMPGNEYSDIWGYTDSLGNEYAIIGSSQAINIVNITDCSNPVLDTSYVDGSTVTWRDFKTYKNYVYGICDGGACTEGLEVINMNTGAFVQYTADFVRAHNIYIDTAHARLYVVGLSTNVPGMPDMLIYDLATNPWNPTLLNAANLGPNADYYIHDVYVKDQIAYASHGWDGFRIYDVSVDTNVVEVGARPEILSRYNHSSWKDPNSEYAYVAYEVPTGIPINVFTIDSMYNISKVNEFSHPLLNVPTLNRPHNPFIKGDSLYISYYHDGVQVWNLDDKLNPRIASYYDTYPSNSDYNGYEGAWGIYPFFDSGCIVASDISTGLWIFKLLPPQIDFKVYPLVFDLAEAGPVFIDSLGNAHKVFLNDVGQITSTPYTPSSNETYIKKGDIHLLEVSSSLILKTANDTYFKIVVNDSYNITTVSVPSLPLARILEEQNMVFDRSENGIYTKTSGGKKVRLTVDNSGNLIAVPHPF